MDQKTMVYNVFKMMAEITFGSRKSMETRLRSVDLTFPQFGALLMLSENDSVTQTELAALLGTDTTTVMVICDSLQKKGCIQRAPDTRDRRVNRLKLTDEGKETLNAANPLIEEFYKPIISALSADQWYDMHELLIGLRNAVKEEKP